MELAHLKVDRRMMNGDVAMEVTVLADVGGFEVARQRCARVRR